MLPLPTRSKCNHLLTSIGIHCVNIAQYSNIQEQRPTSTLQCLNNLFWKLPIVIPVRKSASRGYGVITRAARVTILSRRKRSYCFVSTTRSLSLFHPHSFCISFFASSHDNFIIE
jgi:hypothetical protein